MAAGILPRARIPLHSQTRDTMLELRSEIPQCQTRIPAHHASRCEACSSGSRGSGVQERQRGVVSPVGNGDNNGQAAAASIHSIRPKEMNNFVVIPISMYTCRRPGAARRAGRVIAISLEGSTSAEVALLLPLLPCSCQRERAVQERCVPTATKRALRL